MKSLTNPIIHIWRWWFTPRSTDPTVVYRERALLVLIPIIVLLRALGIVRSYSATSDLPTLYAPLWVSLTFFIIPILFSIYFLAQQKVEWAGAFFILHWYLTDLLSLPVEGYWYPGYQISIIIQAVLGALFLPSRAILYFLIIQLTTTGIWGRWLDVNYFDPPLLATGEPVASFWRAFPTLAAQETIIVFIVRYLRTQMEKSLRLQQVSIQQLEAEVAERQHAEARLRSLVENSPATVMEINRNGEITYTNSTPDLMLGINATQFLEPEDRAWVSQLIEQAFETGEPKTIEVKVNVPRGILRWNSISFGPVFNGHEVTSLVVIATNIDAQKEAELQVKQRAEQLATIVEISHTVSTLHDINSVLETIYQQVGRIAPVDAFFICLYDESNKRLSYPLTYDLDVRYEQSDSWLNPENPLADVIRHGKPFRLHRTPERMAELAAEDGDVGNPNLRSKSILFVPLWETNRVIGALSIQTYSYNSYPDELVEAVVAIGNQASIAIQNARLFTSVQQELSERKQTEQQVQQRLQELAAIHAVSRAATSELEMETLFDLVSSELFNLFDIQEIYFALHNRQADQVDFPYYRSRDQKIETDSVPYGQGLSSRVIMTREPLLINEDYERRSAELGVIRFKLGEYSISKNSWLGVPIQVGENVIGMICVMNLERENAFTKSDVRLLTTIAANVGIAIQNAQLYATAQRELSERRRIEREQEKLIGELGNKNAELERFTYTVSHDLKSPIVTIKGFIGMLEKDMRENRPDRVQSDIRRIASATDKMDALLKDLLELSRIGRIVNPPVEVDTVKLTHEALEILNARIRSKNAQVIVSPNLPSIYCDRTRLREVLENLIDNALKYIGEQPLPQIEIGIRSGDHEPVIFVKDNGMGIDSRYHDRVFRLFEKLNPTSEGTGIGLALVKRIVEVHGGKVWVESEGLGKGSTFCFTIPNNRQAT